MKPEPGTYALLLRNRRSAQIAVGQRRSLRLVPGYYIYVGSAFGPGGVRARVGRHFGKAGRRHWHIDYLRAAADPVCAWCSYAPVRLEHRWARALGRMDGVSGAAGFGCSDCDCESHLFAISRRPADEEIIAVLGEALDVSWPAPPAV